jgi:hypothetical protein
MASSFCTVLDYLCRPNPEVSSSPPISLTLTVNPKWDPIEGVRPWEDFTYENLVSRYRSSLQRSIATFDPNQLIKRGHLNEVKNEDTVTALFIVNNMLPVNNALYEIDKGFQYGPGSKFFRFQEDGSPDWGLGRKDCLNEGLSTLRNFCPGDFKLSAKWTADGLLGATWKTYSRIPYLRDKAKPLEQVQNYATNLKTRYTWILTEFELVVVRVTDSIDDPRSPRPSRNTSHRRVISDASAVSSALSAMPIDTSLHSEYLGSTSGTNPAPLEIARIPWSAGSEVPPRKQLTINLALYCLARLALESDSSISTSYPPLDPRSSLVPEKAIQTGPSSRVGSSNTAEITTYWIPSERIAWDVIRRDVQVYLPGATVRQGLRNGEQVFLVEAGPVDYRQFQDMVADLTADTTAWNREGGDYRSSATHRNREAYGRSIW